MAGIDSAALPELGAAATRQQRLQRIVAARLPAKIEEALVIGVDQRTPEHYALRTGDGEAQLSVRTSWEGDGTVMRDSARLAERVTYPTSFATHDAILSDASVQDFVLATLARGPEAAMEAVPVRERTSILTALGTLVELVGVAIGTDQPLYRTGTMATVHVHLRLGVEEAVDAGAISLTIQRPGGEVVPLRLAPDPLASEPSNRFEQSFSTQFETGVEAGELIVTVAVEGTGGAPPREVTRIIPVIAP